MSKRGYSKTLILIRLLALLVSSCLAYGAMLILTDTPTGKESTPWLPGGNVSASDYRTGAVIGLVAGSGAAGVWTILRACFRRAEGRTGQRRPAWRYREMSRREKRRLAAALVLSSSVMSLPALLAHGQDGRASQMLWVLTVAGAVGNLTGMTMVLVQVRPSRTVMQIVEARLKDERAQMAREMEDMRASDAADMEHWKNETLGKLYTMVMDQVDRGLITCQKCQELGAAHHSASEEEPRVPEPRCECSGPASIPVIYFPPRFQSNRTAS